MRFFLTFAPVVAVSHVVVHSTTPPFARGKHQSSVARVIRSSDVIREEP